MELIVSILGGIGAFLGVVVAHFVAHDAYSRCPRYARTMIERATRSLPSPERERYAEEWLADLHDHEGVFAKFKHAVECFMCARKLAATCKGRSLSAFEFAFDDETLSLDLPSGMFALEGIESVLSKRADLKVDNVQNHEALEEFVRKHGEVGLPSSLQLRRLADAIAKALDKSRRDGDGSINVGVKVSDRALEFDEVRAILTRRFKQNRSSSRK